MQVRSLPHLHDLGSSAYGFDELSQPHPAAGRARTAAAGNRGIMRVTLRFLGLDLIDLCIETDAAVEECEEPGDAMSYPIGFTAPHLVPVEMVCPEYGE